MATIRAYTTIEQSRKLAEILPLESADMYYEWPNKKVHFKDDKYSGMGLSCWSLAALLDVLPDTINGTYCRLIIDKEGDVYNISYDDILSKETVILYAEYSLIDGCYEMVLKLHELKML